MWTHRMDGYMEYVDMEGIYKNKRKNLKSSQLGEDMTIYHYKMKTLDCTGLWK